MGRINQPLYILQKYNFTPLINVTKLSPTQNHLMKKNLILVFINNLSNINKENSVFIIKDQMKITFFYPIKIIVTYAYILFFVFSNL